MRRVFYLFFFMSSAHIHAAEETAFPSAKMFSLSSQEMLFASKLSDLNRRRFCYTFSFKERMLAMGGEDSFTPDEKVDQVYSSLYVGVESNVQAR